MPTLHSSTGYLFEAKNNSKRFSFAIFGMAIIKKEEFCIAHE